MSNDKVEQGADPIHSENEEERVAERGSSSTVGSNAVGDKLLDKETESKGDQDTENQSRGTKANSSLDWSFAHIWNKALENVEPRVMEPRSRMFATELGKAPVDVYLAMKGEQPTNPPNARSMRKFEAGNLWEWIVGIILKRAGIVQKAQERVTHTLPGMCEVSGKSDYIAGGKPNYEGAKEYIATLELPDMFYRGFEQIIEHLEANYPNGLGDKPLEVKSLSSFMFDLIERSKRSLKAHRLQLLHYMIAGNYPVGHIIYICRDDCRMIEMVVVLNDETRAEYEEAVALRSGYYLRDEMPPLEQPIVWDEDIKKFSKNNMGMAYSMYLTKLYGFKDQMEFDEKYSSLTIRYNSALKRRGTALARAKWFAEVGATEDMVQKEKGEGKKTATVQYLELNGEKVYVPPLLAKGYSVTPLNVESFKEIEAMGFNIDELALKVPLDAPDEEEEHA